jgi:hypothetical protein
MLFELARVLRYPRLRAHHRLQEHRIYDYIGFLREISETNSVNPLLAIPIRDVNDIVVDRLRLSARPISLVPRTRISMNPS